MATITSTPSNVSIKFANKNSTSASGTISWSSPSIPSGATVTSCVLTGTITPTSAITSATVGGKTISTSGSFSVNLGTSITTSASVSLAKAKGSTCTVEFANMTYTVTYTEPVAKPTYTVTFKDWDGTTLKTQTVEEGSSATAPSNPSRDGYNFTGWDTSFNNITSNLTVTAQYSIKSYTVTFKDWDGSVLKTQTVNHGSAVTAPNNPSRDGYEFTGWDKDFSNITSDLTVTAQYNKLPIEWTDGLGTITTGLRAHAGSDNYSHDSYIVNFDWENESFDIVITNDINFSDYYMTNPAAIGNIIIGDIVCSISFYKGVNSAGIYMNGLDSFNEYMFNESTFPYTVSFTKSGIYIKATSISGTGNEITIIPNSENIYDGSNKSIRIVDDHIEHSALTYAAASENPDYDIYFDLAVSKYIQLEHVEKSTTLRAESVTEDSTYNNNWTDIANIYDNDTSTYGSLVITGTGQGGFVKDTVTTIFDIDNNIPVNATINSATLTIRAKSSAATNLYMSVDANNDSSKRVMDEQLMDSTSAKNYTVDITDYAKELDTIALTYRTAGSSSRTATVYDIRVDVNYTVYEEVPDDPEEPEIPEVPEIPEGTVPVDYSIALRPISATQDNGYNNTWTNVENTYDTDTSTSGTIIVTGSSQSGFKRKYVDTIFNFDNTIPSNAVINSAVLTIRAKQSSTTNLNITVSIDDNEVISSTLLSSSSANYTADVAAIVKNLNQLNINLTSAATSNRTFTLYDVRVDVDYTVYEEVPDEPENPITYYTVTFKDYDGTVLSTQEVEEGYDAIAPDIPTRDGYAFIGWSKSFTNVSSNLEIIALYESVVVPDEPEKPDNPEEVQTSIMFGRDMIETLYMGDCNIEKIYIGEYLIFSK